MKYSYRPIKFPPDKIATLEDLLDQLKHQSEYNKWTDPLLEFLESKLKRSKK